MSIRFPETPGGCRNLRSCGLWCHGGRLRKRKCHLLILTQRPGITRPIRQHSGPQKPPYLFQAWQSVWGGPPLGLGSSWAGLSFVFLFVRYGTLLVKPPIATVEVFFLRLVLGLSAGRWAVNPVFRLCQSSQKCSEVVFSGPGFGP